MTAYDRVRRVIVQQAVDGEFACSVPEVARLARVSERSVQRALSALRGEGDLLPLRPARQHYPAVYVPAGTLAFEVAARHPSRRLAAVPGVTPGVTPEVTPGVSKSPLAGVTPRGGYRGGYHKGAHENRTARPRQRLASRADGTNPRATAATRRERARHPDAGSVCREHLTERNDAGLCSGCRADQLAAGPSRKEATG